jgi:pullulanase/glycogen debranching enzyme
LQHGLKVVIDCSYAQAAQAWVEQRQHPQQQQQIWGHVQEQQQEQQQQQLEEPTGQLGTHVASQQVQHGASPQLQPGSSSSSSSSGPDSDRSGISTDTCSQSDKAAAKQLQPLAHGRQLVTGTFIHKEVRSVAKQIELAAGINKR